MKARILVIEDVREMADLIALYLGGDGMEVDSCPTGEEGLERFRAKRFDLVVLDINLPGMDGFEFLQRLRRESAVPVVIVSARDADEDMVLGLGIGADEFVTKPFSP
jgi:two-component system response regulator RegX3